MGTNLSIPFVRTIFCPYHFVQYHIVPYTILAIHYVHIILSTTIFSCHLLETLRLIWQHCQQPRTSYCRSIHLLLDLTADAFQGPLQGPSTSQDLSVLTSWHQHLFVILGDGDTVKQLCKWSEKSGLKNPLAETYSLSYLICIA